MGPGCHPKIWQWAQSSPYYRDGHIKHQKKYKWLFGPLLTFRKRQKRRKLGRGFLFQKAWPESFKGLLEGLTPFEALLEGWDSSGTLGTFRVLTALKDIAKEKDIIITTLSGRQAM